MPTSPFPHEQTPGAGARDKNLYIDHRIVLRCAFLAPTPSGSTYLYVPSTHTYMYLNITHTRSDPCRQDLVRLGAALSGTYRCTQAYVHTCAHTSTYSPWDLSLCSDSPLLARNPGYSAKRRPALLRVTLTKPPLDRGSERPANPSPLLSNHPPAPQPGGAELRREQS